MSVGVLVILLILSGCPITYTPEGKEAEEGPAFNRADEMFVSEEAEGGKVRTIFETNNDRYTTLEGMTLWTIWGQEEDFNSRKVVMGKSSGYSGGGYGIVFCQGEREFEGEKSSSMLVVMVNNEGYYIVGKAVGGVFTDFGWWKATPCLNKGAGAENELSVSYEEESGEYRIEINGKYVENFRDEEEPALSGGKNGYIVVVTPYDKFPQSEVAVYFVEGK